MKTFEEHYDRNKINERTPSQVLEFTVADMLNDHAKELEALQKRVDELEAMHKELFKE